MNPRIEQRTLKLGERIVYCYSDGSIELLKSVNQNASILVRTFGSTTSTGYKHICIDGRYFYVHRLIATAFIPNLGNLPEIDHKNRDKSDNRVENLRWVSSKDNMNNRDCVDKSIQKYGVKCTEDKASYNKSYRNVNIPLDAIQPNGKHTTYYFKSVSSPEYKALKPLSQKARYFKYQELCSKEVI